MTTVAEMNKRFEKLDSGIDLMAWDSIDETGKEYAEKNAEQMFEGRLNDGTPITPAYAAKTIAIKKKKGQPYDIVTLRDTGAFHSSMNAMADNDLIRVGGNVDYENDLQKKYSDKIFGLDKEKKSEYTFGPFWGAIKPKIEDVTKLSFV
jgi:hypothetical protein